MRCKLNRSDLSRKDDKKKRKRNDFTHSGYSLIMMNISFVKDGYHELVTGFFVNFSKTKNHVWKS